MRDISATFTSKGQLVVPAELRRKHGIQAGTRVKFLEDQFGRIVLQPITESYVDRIMGCLAEGPDLLAQWEEDHRQEGRRKG
jgi:AbrB family looped-hinge helix DNA binding protein